jgi:hypothetical protein
MSNYVDALLAEGCAERALEDFVDQNFVMEEDVEALGLIDMVMVDPEKPLSEEISSLGLEFIRNLSQEVLDCMEDLRTGAQASLNLILKDMPREV